LGDYFDSSNLTLRQGRIATIDRRRIAGSTISAPQPPAWRSRADTAPSRWAKFYSRRRPISPDSPRRRARPYRARQNFYFM